MNDQFSSYHKRPNLVVVEGLIPKSEVTSGQRAETVLDDGRTITAKDTTGPTQKWNSGDVFKELKKRYGKKRTVYLTNHFKPMRVVEDREVAQHINDLVADTDIKIPYNVVPKGVREELQKLGTPMEQNKQKKYYVEDAEAEDEGLRIKNGTARWTEGRIDSLIHEYGASNPDYSQAYAALINPRDFLRLTLKNESLRKWRDSLENQPEEIKNMPYKEAKRAVWDKMNVEGKLLDDENFPLDRAELEKQEQTPFLYIKSYDNQMVLGHEGRHRMRALMEAGVTSVPVVVQDPDTKYSKKRLDEMTLASTDFINIEDPFVYLTDLVPIKESNRDELIQKFGGDADVRFSLSANDENRGIISEKEIESTLKENFDEYKTDEENLRIATEALDDLQHTRYSVSTADSGYGRGVQVRTIAKGITSSLVNEGYIEFRGKKVKGPEDLAKLCQVLRDPRFETFRIVLTKGDKIVSFRSISSRLPGLSMAFEGNSPDVRDAVDIVRKRMQRLGADGYYLIHNHPSGNVSASFDDLKVTRAYLALLGTNEYKGHIILDHDKYGFIDANAPQIINGETYPSAREEAISGQQTIDLINEPEADHPLLGETVKTTDDIARCGHFVNASNDVSVLLYLNSRMEVRGIQEISNKTIKNDKGIEGFIRNQAVEFGSAIAALYTNDAEVFDRSKGLIEKKLLIDSVIAKPSSYAGFDFNGRATASPDPSYDTLGLTNADVKKNTYVFESAADVDSYDQRFSLAKYDEPYMDAVNSGNMEEAQRLVDEAAKAAMPNTKMKGEWYHGTENDFTVFDFSQGGKNGHAEGFGIYITNDPEISKPYGNRLIKGYVNIERPASALTSTTLTKSELHRLIKRTVEDEALQMAEDYGDDVEAAKFDTWISNYTDTHYAGSIDKAIDEVIKSITQFNGNDMDIIQEIMVGMGIRDYDAASAFYDILTEETGIDGFETKWGDESEMADPNTPTIALAFRSSQIKSSDAVTYAEDGSVIPLSERFDPTNNDIRYSLPTQDANGNVLSDGQMEFFKNSMARDAEGRLLALYHGTASAGFTVFDTTWPSGAPRLIWMTTSRRDADAYGGNWEHKIFDPEEKDWTETVAAGNYNLGDINPSYAYMRFDTEADKEEFIAEHPDVQTAHDYGTLDEMLYNDEIDYDEFDRLVDADKKIVSDYSKYEAKHSMSATWGDVFDNPERFEKRDLARALLAYDKEASIDEEWEDTKEDLLEAMRSIESERIAEDGEEASLRDVAFEARVPVGETQDYLHRVNNRTYALYANLENPLIVDMKGLAMEQGGYAYVDEMVASDEYDGIVIENTSVGRYHDPQTVVIAKSSKQIKDIRNLNPTENPDIRYSIPTEDEIRGKIIATAEDINRVPLADVVLEENRVRYSMASEDFVASIKTDWEKRKHDFSVNTNSTPLKNKLIRLLKDTRKGSGTDRTYSSETLKKTTKSVENMRKLAKNGNIEAFAEEAWKAAKRIVDDINYNDDLFVQYKGLRNYLANTNIKIPDALAYGDYSSEVTQFVLDNGGRMKLKDHGTDIEKVYSQLHKKFPELFPDDIEHPIDMLMQMDYILDYIQPYKDAYTSEDCVKLVENIANNLCAIVDNSDEYKATVDELKVQTMKVRHEEAVRKIREGEKAKRDNQAERAEKWKQKYEQRIKDDVAKRKEKSERKEHKDKFERIRDNYNDLVKWVLKPDKDHYVPEEFRRSLAELLQTLDLQTENSKALEEKTGHVAQTTFKMREFKDQLNKLTQTRTANGSPLFDIDSYVPALLDALADKLDKYGNSIDTLDAHDIKEIDRLFIAIKTNIKNYNNLVYETKMVPLNERGGQVIADQERIKKRDGQAKIYEGGLGGAIKSLNTTSLTPTYFFDRLGPGMKEAYEELRYDGFDQYVRNEAIIIERISGILGKYYKHGLFRKKRPKPGSTIEEWRDDRSAQTIELANGQSVRMTVAQMMSFYCLINREQAKGHIIDGDGIYVTPIQLSSKMEKAKAWAKGRKDDTKTTFITAEDAQNIITKLTPEQINVAKELQKLMAEDMAELGNKAHRMMYGYEIFDDPDYFPIKVHGSELPKDINNIQDVYEKIKSFGPAKPLVENARNIIEIDDIFTVVADHCNGMNLYNSYLIPISNFMKVYNYRMMGEDGNTHTVQEELERTHGREAMKYITNFLADINGIKQTTRGGLEDIMNRALGRAKMGAVFGNIRVALQQPMAIVRAAAEINPVYLTPFLKVRPGKGVLDEMYKYCPIAQWKSWGYYDTYMGRDIEDVMMNNYSASEVALAGVYGLLDNLTWGAIWQGVKQEQKAKHPDMDVKSEEFLQMCGRRASEIFDKTQVVDSTFHRSDAMRSKQIAVKSFTAFMAEPTLTLNMLRGALYQAGEARKDGDFGKAVRIANRAISVVLVQAAVVAAAQAFADAWRGKDPGWPGDDDDDEKSEDYWVRWMHNFVSNLFDGLHLENNMYLVKDITPYFNFGMSKVADHFDMNPWARAVLGWDQDYLYGNNNLVFSSFESTANGISQMFKKIEKGEDYDKEWYDIVQKTLSALGTLTGYPVGTLMRDFKPIFKIVFGVAFAADSTLAEETTADKESVGDKIKGIFGSGKSEEDSGDSSKVKTVGHYTKEQQKEIEKAAEKHGKKTSEEPTEHLTQDEMMFKAEKAAAGYEGSERNKKIYDAVTEGYKKNIENGDFATINMMRRVIEQLGGDVDYFDKQTVSATKTAYKKLINEYEEIGYGSEEFYIQRRMNGYLNKHGVSDEQISSEIVYKSDTAKDLKAAMRLNDQELIETELKPLIQAGLTEADFNKLYKYRNSGWQSYHGKYKDRFKSTGTFIWPTDGTVTSEFGRRSAPTKGASTNHPSIDIGAPQGTAVVAADGGEVIYAGTNSGYGNSVGIKHDNGMVTYYNHLYSYNVKVGDVVGQGQQIAQVGSTGISTGPHLDFKILDSKGNPVNPRKFLK